MRSAVSVILSAPTPESNMSHPDYRQTAHDHASLLILVRHLGSQLSSRTFTRLYDRICRQTSYKIQDSFGNVRNIYTRFVRSYPIENNDWGDFQTHRRVLGLICIGECSNSQEVSELYRIHESLRGKFSSTLYDSRCLFLGLQKDGTPYVPTNCDVPTTEVETDANSKSKSLLSETANTEINHQSPLHLKYHHTNVEIPQLPTPSGDAQSANKSIGSTSTGRDSIDEVAPNSDSPLNKLSHPTRTLYYPSLDKCMSLEADLQDFVSSLFWVLESKRLGALTSVEKDKQPFLCAPFERKDLIGMDLESRTHRKRSVGRWKKHIGDLALQAGMTAEALEQYQAAADLLRPVNDWLWLAGCFEGLCAASITLLYPHLRRPVAIQRIGSLSGEGLSSRNRSGSSGSGALRSLPVDLDNTQHFMKNRYKFNHSLGPDDLLEKYHEAVVHYSKYRNAGVIETEASIKAVQVLAEQGKYLSAAEFLQNVVFINLQLSDDEKIQRFIALSELYSQLGFRRKSSFFRRVSAMRCVAPTTAMQPNWNLCYQLLYESINGYKLSLDPVILSPKKPWGWPALQVQILQELTGTGRRLGNIPLAIRHAALLVHLLLMQQVQGNVPVLSIQEQCDMTKQLEQLSQRSEIPLHPGPLALENGTIIPPVSLTLLPKILSFKLQPPDATLAAHKLKLSEEEEEKLKGPFLFTPIQFGSFRKQPNYKQQVFMDFKWIEGDRCEVVIQAVNPSPYELRITNMQLLTEDVEFESESTSLTLPPCSDQSSTNPTAVTLTGIPRGSGLLKIVGYSMTVLGLKNHCKLKTIMPSLNSAFYSIEVIPALPRLQIQVMSPSNVMFESEPQTMVASSSLQLYAGQSTECNLTVVNESDIAVDNFDLQLIPSNRATSSQVFSFSTENLKAQLPWAPASAACVTVYVHGASDFIVPVVPDYQNNPKYAADDLSSLPSLSGPPSLFSRWSNPTQITGSFGFSSSSRNKVSRAESVISGRSGSSSIRSGSSGLLRAGTESNTSHHIPTKTVSAVIKLEYSGGAGHTAGFCRSSSLSLSVDILPSVIITKWDVLPAETASHCYLVLDIYNGTSQEMELHYSSTKHIAIEAFDSCRIPVPVDRCPLAKLKHIYTEESSLSAEQQLEDIAKICSEHLASLVELKWTLSPSASNVPSGDGDNHSLKTIKGKATLSGLNISPSMLDMLHIPPIQLELRLNREIWSAERAEFTWTMGDVLDVDVSLSNALTTWLGPLNLHISVYQDLQNGTYNRRLDTRILPVGCDRVIFDKVEGNSSLSHHCGFIFFTPGAYKLDIVCSLLPLPDTSRTVQSDGYFHNDATVPSFRHVWKFVPAAEVMVLESCRR